MAAGSGTIQMSDSTPHAADPADRPELPVIDAADIREYHAHVYYQPETRDLAAWLREQLGARFNVTLGRWKTGPVGPHPLPMYQVAFAPVEFSRVVPWLMLNRQGLTILVHPDSGYGHAGDHARRALWLGEPLPLNIGYLEEYDRQLRAKGELRL